MRFLTILAFAALVACAPAAARAQFKPEDEKPGGVKFDKELVQRIRVGLTVKAVGGPCNGLHGTVPLPMDWPEQNVKVVDEEFTSQVKRRPDRTVDGTVKQLVVGVPQLKSGDTAKALVTLEIRRRSILPPDDTSVFSIPEKPDASLRNYLQPSPKIESNNGQIKDIARKVMEDNKDKTAWEQVEAIYDWVRENVEYRNQPLKGALQALKDKHGDCEEMTSLFIALCRANKVPARTVWVPGHCYPEFYLVDRQGEGHWFPCQAAGTRAFGGIPEHRPILQKGDNFRDTDRPRERMRYLSEHLSGKVVKGGGQPRVKFIRQDAATDKTLDDPATDIAPVKPEAEAAADEPPMDTAPGKNAEPEDDARPRFGDPTDRPRGPIVDPEKEKTRRTKPPRPRS